MILQIVFTVISTSPVLMRTCHVKLWNILQQHRIYAAASRVIGAVTFSLWVKVQWFHLFPLSRLLTVWYQHSSHAQRSSLLPHTILSVLRLNDDRQHLCNFTLLPHVQTSLSYSHLFSISLLVSTSFFSSPCWNTRCKKRLRACIYLCFVCLLE